MSHLVDLHRRYGQAPQRLTPRLMMEGRMVAASSENLASRHSQHRRISLRNEIAAAGCLTASTSISISMRSPIMTP